MSLFRKLTSLLLAFAITVSMVPLVARAEEDVPTETAAVTVPAEQTQPPQTEQTVPETEQTLPPTEETVPETEETLPPTEETVPETEETVPPTEETVPEVTGEPVPQATRHTLPAKPEFSHLHMTLEVVEPEPELTTQALSDFVSIPEAVLQMRSQLRDRVSNITLLVKVGDFDPEELYMYLLEEAYAHTGNPTEGDYILYHLGNIQIGMEWTSIGGTNYIRVEYAVIYYANARQEAQLNAMFPSVMASLDLEGKSDANKVKAIYDYITANISYDYAHKDDPTYTLKATAYAALVQKNCVCQGYANLLYRMCLSAGIDCRIITGFSGDPHAWNIVKLDNKYYNLDSTWDAEVEDYGLDYMYFLKSMENFPDHARDQKFLTADFMGRYPMAKEDYRFPVGAYEYTYGDFQFRIKDKAATLTAYKGTDREVVIPGSVDGVPVKYIGVHAFAYNQYLQKVTLPASVISIEDGSLETEPDNIYGAFTLCTNLHTVVIPENASLQTLGAFTFAGCTSLKEIRLPGSIRVLGEGCFFACSALKTLSLPEGLEEVHLGALSGTALRSIHIPASCQDFHRVNQNPYLESVTAASGNPRYRSHEGVLYDNRPVTGSYSGWTLLLYPVNKPAKTYRVADFCTHVFGDTMAGDNRPVYLQTLYIGSAVSAMSPSGGDSFSRIECNVIPDSTNPKYMHQNGLLLTKDGKRLVQAARFFTDTVAIPEGVQILTEYLFWNNQALTRIVLPDSIEVIEDAVFGFCTNLESIVFLGDKPRFENDPFWCMSTTVYYPWDNPTWDNAVIDNYNGTVTLVPSCDGTDHDYTAVPIPATCHSPGGYRYTCTCGHSYEDLSLEPLPHTFGDWETLQELSCTQDQIRQRSCVSVGCGHTETETTPALGHEFGPWEQTLEPTCTEEGQRQRSCLREGCGHFETEPIPVKGHVEVLLEEKLPTCTEEGVTQGSFCLLCKQVLRQQETVPVTEHSFDPNGEGLVCSVCGREMYIHLKQNYLLLDPVTHPSDLLEPQLSHESFASRVQWSVEGEEGIVTVSAEGEVTALKPGTVYVAASVTDGDHVVSARCRVDVAGTVPVPEVQLNTTKVTSELFSTNYASLELLLQLPQNDLTDFAVFSTDGCAIEDIRFTDSAVEQFFTLSALDDRNVRIVPTAFAIANPKAVKGKLVSTLTVTVQGETFETDALTLTVKKTQPKLKIAVESFNSFYSGQRKTLSVTGGTAVAVSVDGSKKNPIPAWLALEGMDLILQPNAPLKNASGKVCLLVHTEEWAIPAAVSVSVKNTYKAPALKLSASNITLSSDAAHSDGIRLKLQPTAKGATLESCGVTGISAPQGYRITELDLADGIFRLLPEEGFRPGKITLAVHFADTDTRLQLPLTVKTAQVTLKPAVTSLTLNLAVRDSARIPITVTPNDYRITMPQIRLTDSKGMDASGRLDVFYREGQLNVAVNDRTQPGAAYKLYFGAGGREAVINVKTVYAQPSVTFSAKGSVDLSFPDQAAVITPKFKNYNGGFSVTAFTAETAQKENVTDRFRVRVEDGKILVRSAHNPNPGTYTLKLRLKLSTGTVENTVKVAVKRTAVKLKLSASTLTLNRQIGDKASIAVTCTTKGYDFTAPVWQLMDKTGKATAEGRLDISYSGGMLHLAVNHSTGFGTTYKILVKADPYAPASVLTVNIPSLAKSQVTSSVSLSGKLDVIREGTSVTVTPSYKNCSVSPDRQEQLVFYSSSDNYRQSVNHLFSVRHNSDGSYTVTRAPGAQLNHTAKYKVQLVSVLGNQTVFSPMVSMNVIMGTGKAMLQTGDATLFARDRFDRLTFRVLPSDPALNSVVQVSIRDAKYKNLFEILDCGNGSFALCFQNGKADPSLSGKTVTLTLDVMLEGNQTVKANTTVKLKLTVVK